MTHTSSHMTHFLPSMRVPTNILTRLSLWEESLCSYTNPNPLEATSCVTSERGRMRGGGGRREGEGGKEGGREKGREGRRERGGKRSGRDA